jgi:poly(3-hydroxybutyrate) depolymerase
MLGSHRILLISLAVLLLLSLAPVAHAADDLSKPGTHEYVLKVDDQNRQIKLHVPKKYDGKTALPLLLMLHGMGGDNRNTDRQTGFNEKADQETFISVHKTPSPRWKADRSSYPGARGRHVSQFRIAYPCGNG